MLQASSMEAESASTWDALVLEFSCCSYLCFSGPLCLGSVEAYKWRVLLNNYTSLNTAEKMKRKDNRVRPGIAVNWKLHHDNAPSHTTSLNDYPAWNGIAMLPQHLYSPDLVRADFFMLPQVKTKIKLHWHGTIAEVKAASTIWLKDVP